MRDARGSGPDGLAGMSLISERNALRLVRPFLDLPSARLRATLTAAGISWLEDPSNRDPRFERTRLRATRDLTPLPSYTPTDRTTWLAHHVELHEAGFALLAPGPWPPDPFARLLQTLSGREHPPPRAATARLAANPRPATLHGVRLLPAGRLGPFLLACREPAALAPPIPIHPGALWDNRFRLAPAPTLPPGWTLGPLGTTPIPPGQPFPAAILQTLPALRDETGALRAVPHLAIFRDMDKIPVTFAPPQPAAPSFFINAPSFCANNRHPGA